MCFLFGCLDLVVFLFIDCLFSFGICEWSVCFIWRCGLDIFIWLRCINCYLAGRLYLIVCWCLMFGVWFYVLRVCVGNFALVGFLYCLYCDYSFASV